MYITNRDKAMLRFIEQHGSITINQAANIFFTNNNFAYDQARKRLRTMYQNNIIKRFKQDIYAEVQYYFDRPVKAHKSKLIDVYGNLSSIGNIAKFEKELKIECKDKYRKIDGFLELEIESENEIAMYPVIIEVDYTHNTSLQKLKEIYESNYFQEIYDVFPTVLIVKKYDWQEKFTTDLFYYKFLNWDLEELKEVFS